jgi:hypothetical protein
MRRRIRIGDVLLAIGVVVLLAAGAAQLREHADQRARTPADRAAFVRFVSQRPGHFGKASVVRYGALDIVCAAHRPRRRRRANYRLCARIARRSGATHVVAVHRRRVRR